MISRDSERSLHICGILLVDSAWKLFVYSVFKKVIFKFGKDKHKIKSKVIKFFIYFSVRIVR